MDENKKELTMKSIIYKKENVTHIYPIKTANIEIDRLFMARQIKNRFHKETDVDKLFEEIEKDGIIEDINLIY